MIAQVHSASMIPEEYLAWEAEQPIKYEDINGAPYAIVNHTRDRTLFYSFNR